MPRRTDRINKHLQRLVGEILHTEADVPPDVLLTVARIETPPNLRTATVWLYIHPPERASEVVGLLNDQIYELQGALNRQLDLRPLPRLRLRIDYGADHAARIEENIKRLHDERGDAS